jgi:hypothetical protein
MLRLVSLARSRWDGAGTIDFWPWIGRPTLVGPFYFAGQVLQRHLTARR